MQLIHGVFIHEIPQIMSAIPPEISDILRARLCVAYLGEATARDWWKGAWKGSFLQATYLDQFLKIILPRTYFSAALKSATIVAANEHDDGKTASAGMYHLFRLPIELEDTVSKHVHSFTGNAARTIISSPESAITSLRNLAKDAKYRSGGGGPTKVGEHGYDAATLSYICAAYLDAFEKQRPVYPYFTIGK